ncbi:PEP-CTERM sorting domain-containing protein [Chlorogloeopsis sp. ULAP02]|uniref:choice-of-anchor Y domain-containing protein n=1 Tax=Chlorogloeopsis sp. ULAP02 TaxID=3107926 RepID=UPI0031369A37
MRNKIVAFTIGLAMLLTANRAMALDGGLILYDGASGVTPDQYNAPSNWLIFGSPNGGTQSFNSGVTNLNTSASNNNGIYGGYSNYNVAVTPNATSPFFNITPTTFVNSSFPSLDRNAGYKLSFTVRINSQVDTQDPSHPRAGFSVIVLSSDKQGIEIGFRTSDIFSQANASFDAVGEQVSNVSSLLSSLSSYDLNISGNSYTLSSGATPLLNGSLRDYTTATGFGSDVYRTSNFIFLGDDTTSARANIDLQSVSVTTNTAAVPFDFSTTPSTLALVVGGTVKLLLRKKKI